MKSKPDKAAMKESPKPSRNAFHPRVTLPRCALGRFANDPFGGIPAPDVVRAIEGNGMAWNLGGNCYSPIQHDEQDGETSGKVAQVRMCRAMRVLLMEVKSRPRWFWSKPRALVAMEWLKPTANQF